MRDDDLFIATDSEIIQRWKEFRVMRGIEICPSNFVVAMAETSNQQQSVLRQYDRCTVYLRDDPVITGWVDRYDVMLTPESHDVLVQGRSKCRDIVDCSAIGLPNGQMLGGNLTSIAKQLCQPFAIKVIDNTSSASIDIPLFTVNLGETVFSIIEKLARYCGVLAYDDTDGNLVLSDVGNSSMGSAIREGVNIQAAAASYSTDQRYSDYYVVWQAVDSLGDIAPGTNVHGHATDPDLKARGIFRPLYIVSEQTMNGEDLAQKRAQWEANRRWGRSQALRVTLAGWRDRNGQLWRPNAMVDLHAPTWKINNQRWIISEVSYIKASNGGTATELVLMPRQAFSVQPIQLYRGNSDIMEGLR